MKTTHVSFEVPSVCVPALIGYNGDKVKDTRVKTNTQIIFSSLSGQFHLVSIIGEEANVITAHRIIIMAIKHHFSSVLTANTSVTCPGREEAELDIKTILSEIDYFQCKH